MPVFTWQGKNAAGEKAQGERAAENKQVLRAALARERIQANVIKEKGGGRSFNFKIGSFDYERMFFIGFDLKEPFAC